SFSTPVKINNAGQVTGYSTRLDDSTHAFLYDSASNTPPVDLTPGGESVPNDLNDEGKVVGQAISADGLTSYAFLYDFSTGITTNLGTLGGTNSLAYAITALGQVVGQAETLSGESHAFLWLPPPAFGLPAGMNDLGTLGGVSSVALGLNNSGQVIGTSQTIGGATFGFFYNPLT